MGQLQLNVGNSEATTPAPTAADVFNALEVRLYAMRRYYALLLHQVTIKSIQPHN